MKTRQFAMASCLVLISNCAFAGKLGVEYSSFISDVRPRSSWKDIRDRDVTKQNLDYSCGASALATILSGYYGMPTTEEAVLQRIPVSDGMASFGDLKQAAATFGFNAVGLSATFEQLQKLNLPAIVYLNLDRPAPHFSVVRGISEDAVWLADPSLGNRTYSAAQFREKWEIKEPSVAKLSGAEGRFLVLLPLSSRAHINRAFFSRHPLRHTNTALQQMLLDSHFR